MVRQTSNQGHKTPTSVSRQGRTTEVLQLRQMASTRRKEKALIGRTGAKPGTFAGSQPPMSRNALRLMQNLGALATIFNG